MKNKCNSTDNLMKRIMRAMAVMVLALSLSVSAVMLAGCTESGAETQVRTDLESMRTLDLDQEVTEELTGMLDKEGRSNYYEFIRKAGEYNYKILETIDNKDGTTTVAVRITSYSFGKAYLDAWSDFLEENPDGDFDPADFYTELMEHLSEVQGKEYVTDVDIICTEDDESGEWTTDAASNYELRNAMLGGMLREIASLAEM
ncbi:MAG: hypothetical protein IKE85_02700 [Mogibacterium sp.]|nr:hypothetical protein [Mogibacterium sp.]